MSDVLDAKVEVIGERARAYFESRSYMCAESVLLALNSELGGGLKDTHAVALAAPFSEGMGGSGCTCGALSGGTLAVGLFTGNGEAYRHRRRSRKFANRLHDAFKTQFGSACCRVLCRKVKHDKKLHFEHCAGMTANAARLAARIILDVRPELARVTADPDAPAPRPASIAEAFRRLIG